MDNPAAFDRVIIADWSASASASPARPSADAIWLGFCDASGVQTEYHRTRRSAEATLTRAITDAVCQSQRLLLGFDFPMGYPAGFAARLTGHQSAQSVWAWLHDHITDADDNSNNRFDVAARMNRLIGGNSGGPFWGRPAHLQLADLPMRKTVDYAALGLTERRRVETVVPRAQPVWKLYTTGAAGSQGLLGQPMIHRLSRMPHTAVWPFQAPDAAVVLAEVYPSLLARAVAADPSLIKDEAQVRLLARALFALSARHALAPLLATNHAHVITEEGWILGADHQTTVQKGLT